MLISLQIFKVYITIMFRAGKNGFIFSVIFLLLQVHESFSMSGYTILSDKVVYSRWRSVISRVVRMPNGKEVDYDVSSSQ